MKPEQLNRLIRTNGRMQPWFLRNTSELYESAMRSYYERGASAMSHSTYIKHPRLLPLEDNDGPVRKLKKAELEPSHADEYPRSHHLQANQAATIAAGHLLPTRMQTSRQRSMSFSVGRPTNDAHQYSLLGQQKGADSSSISCSSVSSGPSQLRLGTEAMPRCLRKSRAMARRERKRMGRRGSRIIDVDNGHQVDIDMRLFSTRSLSVPPPTGLEVGNAPSSVMPPCRKHHMNAIEKTALAKAALLPTGEGDSLMTVDETLKRKISVVEQTGTSSELGHHLMANRKGSGRPNLNLLNVISRQPPQTRFRFHTLGDRAKQFEYIHFADGPVSNYAFYRRPQRKLYKPNNTSSSSSLNTVGRLDSQQMQPQAQPQPQESRPLSARNALHTNHMQRSQSVEATRDHELETPRTPLRPPPLTNGGDVYRHLETLRSTREASVDISSHLSARRRTAGNSSASSVTHREGTAVAHLAPINSEGIKAIKWADSKEDASGSKSSRTDRSGLRVTWQSSVPSAEAGRSLERNNVTNSRPTTPEYRESSVTPKPNSNSAGYNDTKETARDTDWRGSSMAKSSSQRSSVDASSKGSSTDFSDTASGGFAEDSTRGTSSWVRRAQLQGRSAPDEDSKLRNKYKHKMKTTLEKPKVKMPKVTASRVSRLSHLASYQATHNEDNLSPKQKEKSEQREENLDKQDLAQGSRAITAPSSQPVSAQLKPTNHLLASSASQVLAYKRAFRTQQQILKAEALHKQAQPWQKPTSPKPQPNRSGEWSSSTKQLQLPEVDLRPVHLLRQQRQRQGPTLTISRTSVRTALKANAEGKAQRVAGVARAARGSPRSSVKAAAAPVTAPLSPVTARPLLWQKAQPDRTTAATSAKGAVSGAATATMAAAMKSRTKDEEGTPRGGGGGTRRQGAAGSMQQSALTLIMQQQQQQSRNSSGQGNGSGKGSMLFGFRREAANRAAPSLLQRRDESDQTSLPLMTVQSPQHRQHQRQQQQYQQQQQHQQQQHQQQQQYQQQQQQQHQQQQHQQQQQQQQLHHQPRQHNQQQQQQQPPIRQFHFQYTPWRPSY